MSWMDSLTNSVSKYFSSGSGWTDLLGGVLSGVGGIAAGKKAAENEERKNEWAVILAKLKGEEDRKSLDYEMQLKDFYAQQAKADKRMALDTYGQFSVLHRRTPGAVAAAPVRMPERPSLETYNGT